VVLGGMHALSLVFNKCYNFSVEPNSRLLLPNGSLCPWRRFTTLANGTNLV